MVLLVHIAPEGAAAKIRANGIRAARFTKGVLGQEFDRAVWAFPVMESYTLTHSWGRELKRSGTRTLVAVSFQIDDAETVYARHYSGSAVPMRASVAVGYIRTFEDPRGYEIMIPRRIVPTEIIGLRVLPKAIGWRYWPGAKNQPFNLCDCPMCMPRGEVKARRYRERVKVAAGVLPKGAVG